MIYHWTIQAAGVCMVSEGALSTIAQFEFMPVKKYVYSTFYRIPFALIVNIFAILLRYRNYNISS